MALLNWWEVTTPHEDIRKGLMSGAIFAADLGDVVSGKAPLEYCDAGIFFQKTYLTHGLKNLLYNVLSRLSGGKDLPSATAAQAGDPVIQLQTPFGGGKTHALLALYHAVKNREKVKHLEVISKLPESKNAKVAVFVGTQADPIKGRTPWGEISYQLGVYDKVKEHDEKRRSPGKEVLNAILGGDPVLILMDEIVEYAVKAKDFADQISAFSQELTEAVKSKNNCCLVCTLPSSAPYGEAGERALSELQRIYGRVEAVYTPVEGVEIYEIIRKRLFDDLGNEKIRKEVAQSYFDLYQKLGTDVPSDVKEIGYRERIEHAYPFHPELIDVLYERWGSYPTFQRTRGVLRLLAEVVADGLRQKIPSPLIQSSLVNLENQTIRREFIKHIGNEYDSVIAADIAGKNAKAPKIDKEMGSEYEKYGIASGIATSVFLYSFSGAEKKETSLPRIRIALLREGIPHTIVGDAIGKLEEELWYFHSERKQYAFRNRPNLNRVIVDREETISNERIQEELRNLIQKNAGKALEVYLWPEDAKDIPDSKSLKLAILAPEYSYDSEKVKKLTFELFEKAGTGFRVYKNTLFALVMEGAQYFTLSNSLKRFLALIEIQNDKGLIDTLTKESQDELRKKLRDAEKDMPFRILTAYRHLALLEEKGVVWKDLGIPTIGASPSISERVKQYLKDQEKILSRLTPKYILDRAFTRDENEKELRDIYELFLKTQGMPLLENENVLFDTVKEGVRTGFIGVRKGNDVYYNQDVSPVMDFAILRGEVAKEIKERGLKKEVEFEPPFPQSPIYRPTPPQRLGVSRLTVKAKIPWDRLSSVVSGVIKPLKDKGFPPEITIEIKAETENEFDRNTLDTKVKETLLQIGAEIEVWKEE
ncbi:MAG: ATP-binding protein [Spirochaetota bacterium]